MIHVLIKVVHVLFGRITVRFLGPVRATGKSVAGTGVAHQFPLSAL